MKIGILCSGQGTQKYEMLDIIKTDATAKEIIGIASDILDADLFNLDESIDIFENSFAQPFISAYQIAIYNAIKEHIPAVSIFAGYSLGELSLYGCNGSLSPKETIILAQQRASIMNSANSTKSTLLSCQNLPQKLVSLLCKQSNTFISIINVNRHFIIGGEVKNLYEFRDLAEEEGAMIKPLNVKLASHTPLLKTASLDFLKELQNSNFKDPNIPAVSSINNDFIYTKEEAISTLSKQISQTIQWETSLETLIEYGCDTILELGPGKALSSMVTKLDSNISIRSVSDFKTIKGIINWINNKEKLLIA
jgi:[acyl-carrier-protein] S-malonyltransferase